VVRCTRWGDLSHRRQEGGGVGLREVHATVESARLSIVGPAWRQTTFSACVVNRGTAHHDLRVHEVHLLVFVALDELEDVVLHMLHIGKEQWGVHRQDEHTRDLAGI